jgi:hypothetical protein
MAQKSNYAELNRIDELFDKPDSPAKDALLQLRSANWKVVKSRHDSGGDAPEQGLIEAAAALRQSVIRVGGPLVEYYLPYIDSAAQLGI